MFGNWITPGLSILNWFRGWQDVTTSLDPKEAMKLLRSHGVQCSRWTLDNVDGLWVFSVSDGARARDILSRAESAPQPKKHWWG